MSHTNDTATSGPDPAAVHARWRRLIAPWSPGAAANSRTVAEIAGLLGVARTTVYGHLAPGPASS